MNILCGNKKIGSARRSHSTFEIKVRNLFSVLREESVGLITGLFGCSRFTIPVSIDSKQSKNLVSKLINNTKIVSVVSFKM